MIQNYLAEPLVKNYTAPQYPIFISLKNSIHSLNHKKSARDVKADIASFVEKIGAEGEKFVLISLMELIQLPEFKEKQNSSGIVPFFFEILREYSQAETFLSYFPEIVAKFSKQSKLSLLVHNLCQNLKLPLATQISIALSLYLSDRTQMIEQGEAELISKLQSLMKNNEGSEISKKLLQELLFQISRSPQLSLKLEEEYNYLLELSDKHEEKTEVKLYNFIKCDWQFFANEVNIAQKPSQFSFKKVDHLKQLGSYITMQPQLLKNIIAQLGNLTQDQIFECLVMMTEDKPRTDSGVERFVSEYLYSNNKKTAKIDQLRKALSTEFLSKKTNGSWNVDNFINVCNQVSPNIKWQNVFACFDRPKLQINSQQHFLNLMKVFEKTKKIGQKWKVPENIYLKKWNNLYSQALFFIHIFSCKDPEALFLNQIQNKKIQKSVRQCNSLQKQIWGMIDLVQILVQISDYRYISIRQLFENPIQKYPELILMTLSQIRPSKGQPLLDELFSNLLPQYLQNHSTNIKLLDSLWENNQDLVISCICEIYKSESKKENSFNLSRVLDITQSIKDSLIPFTTWNDYEFSIPLAVIAGKRQFLNFEPWIVDRIEKLTNSFVKAILTYIEHYLLRNIRTAPPNQKENILQKAQLTIELLNKIFYPIMSKLKRQEISPRNFEMLKRIFKQCCENFPQITDNQIPDEIQRETEREINRIYKEEITIKQAIQRMKKLRNSNKQEDQEQFASHITFLCSELSYHHTYPIKQLMITAQLFAALINANLIDNKIYMMFLNVLQEGLKEQNQKYTFSLKVIEKIKPKLAEQNWFCEKLIDNDTIMRKNPQIIQQLIKNLTNAKPLSADKEKKIKQAIRQKNAPPPLQPQISIVSPPQEQAISPVHKKVQQSDYEILVVLDTTKKIDIPDKQNKLSKINIACNTLSMNNIDDKSKDLKKIIESDPKIITLLANNIVFKRITITQNNGIEVFFRLVQKIPAIQKPILKITYKILQQWFALKGKSVNDKRLANFKNVGSWLGKLTIGKGMPIPIHKLNLKRILIESYNNMSRVSMNIPIIIKMLEYIHTHPEIFKPVTSPWLHRILGTLNEIEQKLKDEQVAATKNEIKALFKSINMKKQNLPMAETSYLTSSNNGNRILISQLDRHVKVDEELYRKYLPLKIDLKMIITRAVDDSIKEIVAPVIDRAVKIAKVTTKQLITKDFAYEPDPERFRESSYRLVKQMAGPLAQVTCREPLKASMNRSLKNTLMQNLTDLNEIDNIIRKAIQDNLDFGCNLIKLAVIEEAEDVIKKDPAINDAIQMRVSAKMQGISFKNEAIQLQIPAIVPQQLRPRSGGLSSQEYEVYKEFKKKSDQQLSQRSNTEEIINLIMEKGVAKSIKQLLPADYPSREEILNKIHACLAAEANDELQLEYYFELCEMMKEFFDAKECWKSFKQIADLKKKQIHKIVRRLVREKYFPETALGELDKTNEDENKIITLFENWLETAHEGIEPFLRNLEEMFNKSQNQIKIFFSHSLFYAMQKVSESFSEIHDCYDTNYIENYTKLIIISYKTIASNNCSLYLQHTIQAILDVFNKLQNGPAEFSYQRPFFKLFTNLICDVTRKEYDIDHEKVLTFYCVLAKELQKISPISCPSFTCAWMELICNKNFMPALLERYEYWDLYYHLLCSLLKFMREYITEDNLTNKQNCEPYQSFYYAILKLIIVIIHDFPDFLSEFSLQLILLIGPKFCQLANMIISAYPRQMKFQSPLKIDKREDLVAQCKRGGMPKYYKVKFDKPTLNYYLQTDPKETSFKDKLSREDDETIQLLVLYSSWTPQNQLNEAQAMKRLTEILMYSHEQTRVKIVNSILHLIRYPNIVTLFFLDLINEVIFNKQLKDNSIRQLILSSVIERMNSEGPQAWGQIYLALQLQIHSKELLSLNVSPKILEQL